MSGFIWLKIGKEVGPTQHSNGPSGSTKMAENFLTTSATITFSKNDSAP